jgi:hypothetical protein
MATVAIVLREADLAEFELRHVVICGFSESEADCGENDSQNDRSLSRRTKKSSLARKIPVKPNTLYLTDFAVDRKFWRRTTPDLWFVSSAKIFSEQIYTDFSEH